MKSKFYIFSVKDDNTTANYFRKALIKMKFEVIYLTKNFDCSSLKPKDFFFYIDPANDFPFYLEKIKFTTISYFIDVHLELEQRLIFSNFFDYIFIAQKKYVNIFKNYRRKYSISKSVNWLPLACDPEIHFKKNLTRDLEVSFVGQINKLTSKFRYNLINKVLPKYYTNDYTKFYEKNQMGKIYSRSKIILNKSINYDLNMRFFEGLCSGGLLVTDKISNGVNQLFKDKTHYVTYRTIKEAINKINYYLNNKKKRETIAKKGQKHVIKFHTYKHRLLKILNLIHANKLPINKAPIKNMSKYDVSLLYAKVFVILRRPLRILQLILIYNFSFKILLSFTMSFLRYFNSIIPITPQAIRIKIYDIMRV